MANNCVLRVFSQCIGGSSVSALPSGIVNGRPQYLFSFTTVDNDIVNGRIYWDPSVSKWFVEDTDNETIISFLQFDRPQPYGTDKEWENNSLLTYGCLSNSSSFYTTWIGNCPTSNFEFCCPNEDVSKNYFGLINFDLYGYIGSVFYLETPQFSGCATMIDTQLPQGSSVYSEIDSYTQYEDCKNCTGATFSCFNQPIFPVPTPIPVLTADTGCGVSLRLTNECQPITIYPLNVLCNVIDVTTVGGNNGAIQLIISGGTPPYTISWENGNATPSINNLVSGTYNYRVVDYYGDFEVIGSCIVEEPSIPIEPTRDNFCLTINVDYEIDQKTFRFNGIDDYGYPTYLSTDEVYNIYWSLDSIPYKWVLNGGLSQGGMINYNHVSPPITDWEWTNSSFGDTSGILGDCQSYGDLCMILNIDSLSSSPYKIQFQQSENIDGYPSWSDTQGQYEIVFEDGDRPYWYLNGLSDENSFTIVNYNTQVPPLNGWSVQGTIGTVRISEGFCFSETICVNFGADCGNENIEMVSGDLINGQQSWDGILPCNTAGNNWFIFYDSTEQVWSTSGITVVPDVPVEGKLGNSVYLGPFGSFYTFNFYGLNVSEGVCGSEGSLRLNVTVNNPVSDSDGGIVIEADGGSSPYEYSIDGGTTYQKFPIFSNLKFGTYVIAVRDNYGLVKKQSVVLDLPPQKVSYRVSLVTTSKRTVSSPTTNTVEYLTYLRVQPELPQGVTLNFNLSHNDLYRISPSVSSAELTYGTILLKNDSEISIDNVNVSELTTSNTKLGCQDKTIYVTATTESWYNLTITKDDTIKIITTVSNYIPQKISCILVENTESYSLSNLRIQGCTNCQVINQDSVPLITPTTNPTPNSTPTVSTPAVTTSTGPTICFDYTFSSVSYKDTKTPSGSYSGYYYYTLTHGVVWSNGGVYWYWSNVLGNDTTFYDRLYNGVQSTPNSLSYSWQNPFGSTGLMNTSLIGACS